MAEYSCHLTQVASLSTATEISLDILSVTLSQDNGAQCGTGGTVCTVGGSEPGRDSENGV